MHAKISRASFFYRPNAWCTKIYRIQVAKFSLTPYCNNDSKLSVMKEICRPEPADWSKLPSRPPVIAIMGHVDHGKTSILDRFRKSRIVAQEFGSITQHIGAFSVTLPGGQQVTILDTPGHAAFEAMRARGASVTDICVLVVAADDGVKPQTVEAIRHIKASGVPLIVAINKIDKPAADINATMGSLAKHDVIVEDYGGDVPCVGVSALTGANFDQLEEVILAVAEVEDLRGDATGPAEGVILETKRDLQKGILASVLVTRGMLKTRDILVSGKASCRVRTMTDDRATVQKSAGPSKTVEISGWRDLPEAGDLVVCVPSDDAARKVGERVKVLDSARNVQTAETTESANTLALVIIADTHGSLEAIEDCIKNLPFQDELCVKVVSSKVGHVAEGDIKNAAVCGAEVYMFGQSRPPSRQLTALAASLNIALKSFRVIYDFLNEIKLTMADRLPPIVTEETLGEGNILAEFSAAGGSRVAGSRVLTGKISTIPDTYIRLFEENSKDSVWEGQIKELRHFKDRVKEISAPKECGILFEHSAPFKIPMRFVCIKKHFTKRVVN